jgi:predicted RNase H-like nuclease (RuvC/YqgF family)
LGQFEAWWVGVAELAQNNNINSLEKSLKNQEKQISEIEKLQKSGKEKESLEFKDQQKINDFIKRQKQQDEIMKEFSKSRIYIGCSESDGISTSFLESLITGAYPIQTNTSCANEWILKGAIASLVSLDSKAILKEVRIALSDDSLVNNASWVNYEVSRKFLAKSEIKKIASEFYH